MYTLDELALHHGADKSTRFHGYAPIYDALFTPLRQKQIRLLEIGVAFGPSMKLWLDYFPQAIVIGVDVAPHFQTNDPRYYEVIADQTDASKMQWVAKSYGPFDIVIDDGCHLASAAYVSFEALWPGVRAGGLYIIEDTGTYWHPMYRSSVQGWTWLHSFIDDVNQRGKNFHGAPSTGTPVGLETQIKSARFWKGLAVLEKV